MSEFDAAALVAQHVPSGFLAEAVRTVREAEQTYGANTDRREWAVHFLMTHLHAPEWMSRLLIELAVGLIKTQRHPDPSS
jgi:hypothetical protein